jgi:hypothetical protein
VFREVQVLKAETAIRYAALLALLPDALVPANGQLAATPGIAGMATGPRKEPMG